MTYYPSDAMFLTQGEPISLMNILYRTRVARILADADNQVAAVIQRQPLKVVTAIEQRVIDGYVTTYSLSANQAAILARLRLSYTNAIEMGYLATILAGLTTPIVYLLRDQFPGSASAPLTSPRTCDPGPGVITFTDPNSIISIASGKLVVSGSMNPPATADAGYITTQFTRAAGLVSIWTFGTVTTPSNARFGWRETAIASNVRIGFIYASTTLFQEVVSTAIMPAFASAPTAHAIVEYATGGAWFARVAGVWELVWRFTDDATATMGAMLFLSRFFNPDFQIDEQVIRQLPAPFDTTFGISTFTDTTLADLDTFTGTADAIISLEMTLSGAASAGDIVGYKYRMQDASNYWYAYVKRNAGNTDWDVLIDSVAAGVATNRLTVTGVGSVNLLRIIAIGSTHNAYTRTTTAWTKRGAQVSVSHMNTQTGMQLIAAAGTTLTRLTSDPKVSAVYTSELDRS